jgi:hypothetical protein
MRRPVVHAARLISIGIREYAMELTFKMRNTLYGSSHRGKHGIVSYLA